MTIRDSDVIDWMGLEKESGHILLTLLDDLDWTDEDSHILALQEKLNTYLAFIESQEVFSRLSEEVGRDLLQDTPIKVSILAKFPLSERGKAFLDYARRSFKSAGFELFYKVIYVQ